MNPIIALVSSHLYFVISLFSALAVFMGAACTTGESSVSTQNSASSLPPIVATVNGRPVTTKLYEMYLKNGREALGLDPGTVEGRTKLDQLREAIVSELIDRTLITVESERQGLVITPERLSEAERQSIAEFGGEQQYDSYLSGHRITRDEYRAVVRMEVYAALLRKELNKGLSVSEDEIENYYRAHRSEPNFQKQEHVTAAHILIAARPNLISQQLQRERSLSGEALAAAVRTEMAQRRQRAEELRKKALAGTDFARLARESSDDQGTRAQGGGLGSFTRNSHARAFDDAAFSLKPGKISAVVQTDYGFHVIKVLSRTPARTQTLAEATPEIRRLLLGRREAEKLTEWLKLARRNASVRINEPFRFGSLKSEFAAN